MLPIHKYDDNISNELIEVNLWKLLIYIYFNTLMINHNKSVFASVIPPIKLYLYTIPSSLLVRVGNSDTKFYLRKYK